MESTSRKKRYKDLLDLGSKLRTTTEIDDEVQTITQVSKIIKESDILNGQGSMQDHANNTTEVVMDAQVIQMSHELIGAVLHKIESSEFSDEEFINAINNIVYTEDNPNWEEICEIAAKASKTCKFSSCLLGSFDRAIGPKPEKERQKRIKATQSEERRPESVEKLDRVDKGAQKLNIILVELAKIFEKNNKQPIPYYRVIIDPQNFMNTIDNAFQIAFLVSNRLAAIEEGDDGLPAVRPIPRIKGVEPDKTTVQSVSSMNINIYKDMIKQYQIREPLLTVNKGSEDS